MKKYIAKTLLLTLALLAAGASPAFAQSPDGLREGFKNPSGTARPKVYWWWLNGHTDATLLKEELRSIKAAGLGGADIFEIGFRPYGQVPAGPAFMGDESLNTIVTAIEEATELGLEVGLNLASSWNAGGSWVTPQHAAKSLYVSKILVSRSGQQSIKVPFPDVPKVDGKGRELLIEFASDGRPVFRQEVALLAIPLKADAKYLDASRIVDVSQYFNPETDELEWKVPPSDASPEEWEIHRYVCSNSGDPLLLPSPNSIGPIIDHFDSTATEMHFMYFIDKLKPRLGDFRKTALKNLYLASFEAKNSVWTPTLAAKFKALNGYEIDKYLPYIFDKNAFDPATTARFKQDFNLTLSELMINNHYRKGREIANRYGLNLISESGGPGPPLHNVPVEAIKALGALSVPRGEFWIDHEVLDKTRDSVDLLMLVKEVAAASHLYQRGITEMEAFTSFLNWQVGPGDMRPVGDRAFCEGMSRVVIHGFTHNPTRDDFPGNVYAAGTHFNVKNTWFSKAKPFVEYLSRVSHVLQKTDFVADVLYYYGNKVPNFGTPKNSRFAVGSGYDYELINTEKLMELRVENGMLTLPYGAKFKVLVLDEIVGEAPDILRKLDELAKAGAIITGRKPYPTTPVLEILQNNNLRPDFDYPGKGSARLDYMKDSQPLLDFIHHQKGNQDFYFVRNTSEETVARLCSFRQRGKVPELWNAVTGEIVPVSVFNQKQDHIEVPLTFGPHDSFFVVFGPGKRAPVYQSVASSATHPPLFKYTSAGLQFLENGSYELKGGAKTKNIENVMRSKRIEGPWDVQFTKNWGAPEKVTFPELVSWTESPDKNIRHYSGTGTYTKTFDYQKPTDRTAKVYLDLGQVGKVAELRLNGQSLGIRWTPPYRYDVTDVVKSGENSITIEVVNTWANRIIGDVNEGENYTKTNLKVKGSRGLLWSETPLLPSGLMGPVEIQVVQPVK